MLLVGLLTVFDDFLFLFFPYCETVLRSSNVEVADAVPWSVRFKATNQGEAEKSAVITY